MRPAAASSRMFGLVHALARGRTFAPAHAATAGTAHTGGPRMHTAGRRALLPIGLSLLSLAALSASTAAAAEAPVRTYRVEGVRTAEDRAAVARTGVAILGRDHGAAAFPAADADITATTRWSTRRRRSPPRIPRSCAAARAGRSPRRPTAPRRRSRRPRPRSPALGAANNDNGARATPRVNLGAFAGRTVQLVVEAAGLSGASLVEAAVDDVRVTRG